VPFVNAILPVFISVEQKKYYRSEPNDLLPGYFYEKTRLSP
jgi:hypothetical protein